MAEISPTSAANEVHAADVAPRLVGGAKATQLGPVGLQLVQQHALLLVRIDAVDRRQVDHHAQHSRTFDVPQEAMAEALAFAGALDETRNVGNHVLGVVVPDHTEIGFQRGERVVGDLRLGRTDDADERALAHVGEAHQRHVGHQLQLQLQPLVVAFLALLGERRSTAAVGCELGVAAAAAAAGARKPTVTVVGQVGHQLAGVQVGDDRALGHHHLQVLAVGNQPHVAALAAIATVGATEGDGAFPTERDAARATIATAHVQLGFIDKSAHRTP